MADFHAAVLAHAEALAGAMPAGLARDAVEEELARLRISRDRAVRARAQWASERC